MLEVVLVGLGVNCETVLLHLSRLLGRGFHQAESNQEAEWLKETVLFFYRCKLVEAGGENVVVVVIEVRGAMEVNEGRGGHFSREGG